MINLPTPVFMLVYTSRATVPITTRLIGNIMAYSYRNNERDQITGFLVTRDRYFLQLIEGPEEKVRECFARITADPRHTDVIKRGEASANERFMPTWSMGFVEHDEGLTSTLELFSLFDLGQNAPGEVEPSVLMNMLSVFAKNAHVIHFPIADEGMNEEPKKEERPAEQNFRE